MVSHVKGAYTGIEGNGTPDGLRSDAFKGRMKEAAGAITGDEDKKAEGRAQQRKGAAEEEATQKE